MENRDDKKWPVYGEKKKEEPIDIELEPDIKDIPKIEKEDNEYLLIKVYSKNNRSSKKQTHTWW